MQQKNSYNACAAFGCKYHSAKYRDFLFLIPSGKTDNSEAMDSQLRVGWLEAHAICYTLFSSF